MVSTRPTRAVIALAATLLAPLGAVTLAGAAAEPPGTPRAEPAGMRAEITWTKHGIPHIEARDFTSLGLGSGYAATEMSACTLFDTLVTGRGERSRWFGPEARYNDQVTLDATNLQVDTLVTDLHDRKVVETLLADEVRGPGRQARALVKGYVAGVNEWVRDHDVRDPACRGAAYLRPDVTTLDLWYGVYLANLLASTGVFVPQIADASPPSPDDPGLPSLPVRASAGRRGRAAARPGARPRGAVRLERHRGRRRRDVHRPAGCCWATRTSRGAVATTSPSST